MVAMTETANYALKVYNNYLYIWKARNEIFWEQILLDPAQDTIIENIFQRIIRFGHNKIAPGDQGLHELLHQVPLPFGLNVHTPGVEFLLHAGIKAGATLIFPFVYPILNSSFTDSISPELRNIVIQPVKFFGINPLEGLHSVKFLSGENSTVGNMIEYLSYSENYHLDRASDESFKLYMDSYKLWMESIDAALHARGELSILYNNRQLSNMELKASLYLHARLYLYETTNEAEEVSNKKIELLKASHDSGTCTNISHVHFAPQESSTWSDWAYNGASWLYEHKGYVAYNTLKTLHTAYTVYKAINPIVQMFYPNIIGSSHRVPSENLGVLLELVQHQNEQQIVEVGRLASEIAVEAIKSATKNAIIQKTIDALEQYEQAEAHLSVSSIQEDLLVVSISKEDLTLVTDDLPRAVPTPINTPDRSGSRGVPASPVLRIIAVEGRENSFKSLSSLRLNLEGIEESNDLDIMSPKGDLPDLPVVVKKGLPIKSAFSVFCGTAGNVFKLLSTEHTGDCCKDHLPGEIVAGNLGSEWDD